jgi:hypothetical protein
LVETVGTQVLHVIAFLDAEGQAAYGVEPEEAHYYTPTELVTSALILQLRALFLVTGGAFDHEGGPPAVDPGYTLKLPLFLGQ